MDFRSKRVGVWHAMSIGWWFIVGFTYKSLRSIVVIR